MLLIKLSLIFLLVGLMHLPVHAYGSIKEYDVINILYSCFLFLFLSVACMIIAMLVHVIQLG